MQIIIKDKVYQLEIKSLVGTNYRKATLAEVKDNDSDLAYAYAALYNDYRGKLDFSFDDFMFDITDEVALEITRFLKKRVQEVSESFVKQVEGKKGKNAVPSQSGNSTSE